MEMFIEAFIKFFRDFFAEKVFRDFFVEKCFRDFFYTEVPYSEGVVVECREGGCSEVVYRDVGYRTAVIVRLGIVRVVVVKLCA